MNGISASGRLNHIAFVAFATFAGYFYAPEIYLSKYIYLIKYILKIYLKIYKRVSMDDCLRYVVIKLNSSLYTHGYGIQFVCISILSIIWKQKNIGFNFKFCKDNLAYFLPVTILFYSLYNYNNL